MRAAAIVLLIALTLTAHAGERQRRQAYLDEIRETLPTVDSFEAWLEVSGELPPDFSAMPSIPGLPPLLTTAEGEAVATPDAWKAHRLALLEDVKHYIIGSVPPPPDNMTATVLAEEITEGTRRREVELRFGPDHKAKLWCELFIPPGPGPHPVFMTQDNHRGWAQIAVRRGYLAVVYAGADIRDDTATFVDAYPEYDWSKLTRRGWAASRCIDYLEQSVPEADRARIALTGHSRNGKTSLMAAALDERIACVISSSSGAGGSNPARLYGEEFFGEGIELITRNFPDWFTPRWRFFAGRADKLPVDLHTLVALSAPRACLLAVAVNDGVESTWAVQETYKAVKPVYTLHGAEERFKISWRPNGHDTHPTTIETYLDWCDVQFDRGHYDFPERFIYPQFRDASVNPPAPGAERPFSPREEPLDKAALKTAVAAMLGEAPPATPTILTKYGATPAYADHQLGRVDPPAGTVRHQIVFGEYVSGDLYLPEAAAADPAAKLPVVLWLHPVSNARGYVAAYMRGPQPFRTFAQAGYAVFCFDQIGNGRRVEEGEHFYRRHPKWSLLGKTLRDAQAALDAIAQQPDLDASRVYVVGFALGATTALHLAAVDDRPAGYALVAPPAPFRLDPAGGPYGGLRRWYHDLAYLPNLGAFAADDLSRIPYDLTDCMAAIAPKPLLVVTPEIGRETAAYTKEDAIEPVRRAYDRAAAGAFTHETPHAHVHFDADMQGLALSWLESVAPPYTPPAAEIGK